jgi:hypothetical protein
MEDSPPIVPGYIDKIVKFTDGSSYELLKPLATYRSCHDGTPAEARIVLTCRRTEADTSSTDEYVVKIKIQYCELSASFSPLKEMKLTSAGESREASNDPAIRLNPAPAPRRHMSSRR